MRFLWDFDGNVKGFSMILLSSAEWRERQKNRLELLGVSQASNRFGISDSENMWDFWDHHAQVAKMVNRWLLSMLFLNGWLFFVFFCQLS